MLLLSGLIVCLTGCISSLYLPTEIDAQKYNCSLETLKTGRELYINKCGGCHNLYFPQSRTKQEWQEVMNKMQKRSKIENQQKDLILKYLETNSKALRRIE